MNNDFKRPTEEDKDEVWEVIHADMIRLTTGLVDYGEPFAHATFATMIQTYCEVTDTDPFEYCLELGMSIGRALKLGKDLDNDDN